MKKTVIELLLLLLISSLIIFYQFNKIPKKLSWDEIEFTRLALSLSNKSYIPYSQLATGHSTLYFYIILGSIKTFGLTNFALRFPAALFGVLNIIVFYSIGNLVFPKIKYFPKRLFPISHFSFLISLTLITSRWYFNFARFSFEATFLLFLELASIYFFFSFLRNTSGIKFHPRGESKEQTKQHLGGVIYSEVKLCLSAVFSGLAFLSYYPGRIFFILPVIFLIVSSTKKLLKKNLIIFFVCFFIVTAPLLIYLVSHKDLRIQEQLFLTDKKLSIADKVSYFGINTAKISFMFTNFGDLNGRHNYPGKALFNPVLGTFFLFGFLVTILNLKKSFSNQFFLSYFILSLIPALFTYPMENPNSLRTYTAVVSSIYFLGNGLVYLLQSEQKSKLLLLVVSTVLLTLFALSSLYELRTYFLYQRTVFTKSFELNGTIKRIINLKLWEKTGQL